MDSKGWIVRVQRVQGTADAFAQLKELGGYSFTHIATVSRSDGATFGFDEIDPVIDGLWHLLGFAAGTYVGIGLPVGLDDGGQPIGVRHSVTVVSSFASRLSWLDSLHLNDIGSLFPEWCRLRDDPFWSSTIKRAIRRCITANTADPLDESIVTALSCLELLAWAILQIEHHWLNLPGDGELTLAGQLRLLLHWTGIDPAIPPQLTALIAMTKEDSNIIDGPSALARIRNRSVHPPRLPKSGVPGWPSADRLHEGWRLALEYADLVILRLLGHMGEYGSRLHMDGRWTGEMTPVPWDAPYSG